MSELNKKDIILENGKVVIKDEAIIESLMDQGMQFSDDGSLDLDDGQDVKLSITFSVG